MPKQSKKKGRTTTSYKKNIVASLRVMQKNNPDTINQAYEIASSVLGYAKDSIFSLFTKQEAPPTPVKIDIESDSKELNAQLEKLQSQITKFFQEKKLIDKEAAQLKKTKKKLSPQKAQRQIELLELIDELQVKKVELLPEMIREHAARRVDLFFLTMIAVYKKNIVISKGSTVLQHGGGSKKTGTAACHASLFPHIEAEPTTPSTSLTSWPLSFFQSSSTPSLTVDTIDNFLKDTHFEDTLNMTTELPKVVNDFDGHMEGKYLQSNAVKECLAILNRVSKGEINPIEGMDDFCNIMNLFFQAMEYRYVVPEPKYSNYANVPYPKAFTKVWEYEKEGTFRAIYQDTLKPKKDYLYMMLNLNKLTGMQMFTSLVYQGPIEQRILDIQKEIHSSVSARAENNGLSK
jgi:hypothetical protein